MKKLIAGNWKMNASLAGNETLVNELRAGIGAPACDVAICVPSPYFQQVQGLLAGQDTIVMGSQNVSSHESGAYTGDVSATMLKEFGIRYAIVGHSERRLHQAESDTHVAIKAERALEAGITPIVCVGETLREREEGMTEFIVKRQLAAVIHLVGHCISEIVVAYEPVWAIGTGKTATSAQAQDVVVDPRTEVEFPHPASRRGGGELVGGRGAEPGRAHRRRRRDRHERRHVHRAVRPEPGLDVHRERGALDLGVVRAQRHVGGRRVVPGRPPRDRGAGRRRHPLHRRRRQQRPVRRRPGDHHRSRRGHAREHPCAG